MPVNAQIQSEAADWLVEFQLGEADAPARERFAGWLRRSPEHVRAYLELLTVWEDACHYDERRALDLDALIAAARKEPNVVSLVDAEVGDRATRAASAKHLGLAIAASVAALLVFAGVLFLSRPVEYATGGGERRTMTLADGTNVELDAESRIRVRFSARERRVTLLEGQAYFRVAKNAARPFLVVSGATRIRDVGTQFDVNRTSSRTIVTVVEGRVSVSYPSLAEPASGRPAMHAIEIGAGEEVVVAPHLMPRPEPADLGTAVAWTRNELIFDSTPLPQVAMEFNRLNTRQLVIEGPQLQSFHVSGVFPALDPTSLPRLLAFLRAQPGIRVTEAGDRIIVAEK
jgi:transmembrane sensor